VTAKNSIDHSCCDGEAAIVAPVRIGTVYQPALVAYLTRRAALLIRAVPEAGPAQSL
jgi:hypothetical protein